MSRQEPILEVMDLVKYYGSQGSITKALRGTSMAASRGEFVGVMGPPGLASRACIKRPLAPIQRKGLFAACYASLG